MATANALCYFPNGNVNLKSESCNPDADVSHCCGPSTFVCLSNGLCWDTIANHLIRGSCTDATWTDGRCPQYCQNDTTDVYGDLRQCNGPSQRWQCGTYVDDCTLDNSFGLPIGYIDDNRSTTLSAIIALPTAYTQASAGTVPTATTTVTQVSAGTGPTATRTVTVTRTATAQPSPTAKSSDVATLGLSTGLGVGLPLLAALCFSLFLLYRARKMLNAPERGQYAGHPQ